MVTASEYSQWPVVRPAPLTFDSIGTGLIPHEAFRAILSDPEWLGKVPYFLETPNYTTIRPGHNEVLRYLELERHVHEWRWLEAIICMTDTEFEGAEFRTRQSAYNRNKLHLEGQINRYIKTRTQDGSFQHKWKADVRRRNKLRGFVSRVKLSREGRSSRPHSTANSKKRTQPEHLAVTEALDMGAWDPEDHVTDGGALESGVRLLRKRQRVPDYRSLDLRRPMAAVARPLVDRRERGVLGPRAADTARRATATYRTGSGRLTNRVVYT